MNTNRLPILSVVGRGGGAIAAVVLALGIAGCTRTMSLGAAGKGDGGDAQALADAMPADSPILILDAASSDTLGDGIILVDAASSDVPTDTQIVDAQAATCTDNGVIYHSGDIIPRGRPGCLMSCLCLSDGTVGACTGVACPPDSGASDSSIPTEALLCSTTGGQISTNLCCASSGAFPNTCAVGACSCAPSASTNVDTCACPNGSCFDPAIGCVGLPNVCTVGDDQTCNDNIALNAFHGHCLAGGRCSCITGSILLASGKCS